MNSRRNGNSVWPRRVPRVGLRHALAVGGLERCFLLALQDVQISRQPGALGPFLHRIFAFQNLQIFRLPDIDVFGQRRQQAVIKGRLLDRRRRYEMLDLDCATARSMRFPRSADAKARRNCAASAPQGYRRARPFHQRGKQCGMIRQPVQRRIGIDHVDISAQAAMIRDPDAAIRRSGAAFLPAATISAEPSTPTTAASGHLSLISLVTLPAPAPRSATLAHREIRNAHQQVDRRP